MISSSTESSPVSFYSDQELEQQGFASVGANVQISRFARFYGRSRIYVGDNSRIDDFCVVSAGSGGIRIGRHVHVAVMSALIGDAPIVLDDFANVSSRVSVYSSSDDFSGAVMTNPTIPPEFSGVVSELVHIGRHVVIGAGCVILPGTTLYEGAALGSLSLARGQLESFMIYAGVPARPIRPRKRDLLELELQFEDRRI